MTLTPKELRSQRAHDLRARLAVMKASVEILLLDDTLTPDAQALARSIDEEIEEMKEMLNAHDAEL